MLNNEIVLPDPIINTHCHGRDMEESYKSTVEQILAEGLNGLISINIFMPNTKPPITTMVVLLRYIEIIEKAKKKLGIENDQYVLFGVTDDNLNECESAIKHPRVLGFKIYPRKKEGGSVTHGLIGISDEKVMVAVMHLAKKNNKVVVVHCDDPEIIEKEGHTINAEVTYVIKIIRLAKQVPSVKILIAHPSCDQSALAIQNARSEGMKIAPEIEPHYFWFDGSGTNWNPQIDPVFYHCFNKLRGYGQRSYLHCLIATDYFVIIGSDHAPHTKEEKMEKGLAGLPTIQEMVPVICTLAKKYNLSTNRISDLLCFNAAGFFGIPVKVKLVPYRLEEKIDDLEYNNGIVLNPWKGSKLLFPVKI